MRIIAGKYKRTPLKTLQGEDITRPTRDMVREALFSSIQIYSDSSLLDLFSGTGAIGIEALSRGASEVVFNDINKDAVRIIRENLKKVKEEREVCNLDYAACLSALKDRKFDYIYIDPPYAFKEYEKVFELIDSYEMLKQDGTVIVEAEKETSLPEKVSGLSLYKEKRYGINKLLYYEKGD